MPVSKIAFFKAKLLAAAAALCFLLFVFPTFASADVETVNFDSPFPLNAPVTASAGGRIKFSLQEGFRPYPTEVGEALAQSGTAVGDIGRCVQETEARGEDNPESCVGSSRQAKTIITLTETAKAVTIFAGKFTESDPQASVTLNAFDAGGNLLATTHAIQLPPASSGFSQRLEVESTTGKIAKFSVETRTRATQNGSEEGGLDLGIDSVEVSFAGGTDPDFFLTTINQVVPLVQGQHIDMRVQVNRLNGSRGSIELSAEGLPAGVSANVVQLNDNEMTATIRLMADPSAPDTDFVPTVGRVIARPTDLAAGVNGFRATPLSVRVAADFKLSSGGIGEEEKKIFVQTPDCAPVDVPIKIVRDLAMTRNVNLSVEEEGQTGPGPLKDMRAEFVPDATVPPGGALVAERTLRLRAQPPSDLASSSKNLILEGSDEPGSPRRSLELRTTRIAGANIATSAPGSGYGFTPRFGKEGSAVQIHGLGFCPGTEVEVGNDRSTTPTRLVNDHMIEFHVLPFATSGPVRIIPPGTLQSYHTTDSLIIDSVRNTDGFAFKNYPSDGWG